MDHKNGIRITTRDRLLRAWENATELVRDFQNYAMEIQDNAEAVKLFSEFAEDEALHAAKLLDILRGYEKQ